MNRQQIIFSIIFYFLNINWAISQEHDTFYTQPAQVTFITPLGTNGWVAGHTINNFSLNLLMGVSAGVKGAEIGGLINHTAGAVSGVQVGGLYNWNTSHVVGTQIGGLFNRITTFQGLQAAGLANINVRKSQVSEHKHYNSQGIQIGGLLNIHPTPIVGVQVAGLLNQQNDSIRGLQVAGLINAAHNKIRGLQVAGIMNKAKIVSGVQIGLINIADTVKNGVQIGLINIVKNGYSAVEIESNETFYLGVNYKLGAERLYTIFSVAYTEQERKKFWTVGGGFGSYLPIGYRTALNIDALHYWVNEDEWWTNKTNILEKVKINGSYYLTPGVVLYGGFSMNLHISKIENEDGKPTGSLLNTSHAFYEKSHKHTHLILYPGINIGVRF